MYIAPNSTIKFLSNVPLDDTFENTLFHTSLANQIATFETFTAYTLTEQSYVRESENTLRVSLSTTQLYNCNYLMFKNTSFENKWFFAFITAIRYRANGTSYVDFKLDPLQTWYFDFQVEPSFIEREHSATDNPGDNLVPENLETGEYISNGWHEMIPISGLDNGMRIVFGCTFGYDSSGGTPEARFPDFEGATFNGIFSGLALHVFDSVTDARAFIHQVLNDKKISGIVCAYMMPAVFLSSLEDHSSMVPYLQNHPVTISSKPTTFPGMQSYSIKNKKLLTAPYIQLYVTNNNGTTAVFPFEYFSDSTITFQLYGSETPDPAVFAIPTNYKGLVFNWDEKIMLKGFPVCSFDVDSYKAWLAQSGSAVAVSNMSSAMSNMVTMASGNYIAGGMGMINTAANAVQQVYQHSIMPPQLHGSVSGNALYSAGLLNINWTVKYIRPEFVYIIDDYFDRFGYATHRVKTPNVFNGFANRPHWCYLQTKQAGLKGNVPGDDLRTIQSIFDKGVTYWKVPSEVGNYNMNNSPL